LRDAAVAGQFDRLYIHSSDRFKLKYADQVLPLEEFQIDGAEVVSVDSGLSVAG
jgi:hypothetical protein